MKKTLTAIIFVFAALSSIAQQKSSVWSPDNGDGTYSNPVLYADYSDPDVCAVGDDYYLTASSFNCIPGLPILHSKDLVNWEIVGHALRELKPLDVFNSPQHGKGVWAPSIRYHDGMFYIYWGDPDYGVFMVKTDNPPGKWSDPICVIPGKGMIDTCPLWDDDGSCYLVNGWAASRAGLNSVLTVRELSPDGTHPISLPCIVFDGGQENHTTEGPKFYKHDGYYWILCPAGGVEMGWQLAMRSKSPYGPYEWKKVLQQGKTGINGPHQGAWVHTPYDEDWFLHFNDKGAYGRVVFLQPVDWSSGWPLIGAKGEPVLKYRKPKASTNVVANPQENDEFDRNELGQQWQWHANYDQYYGMPTSEGTYRMYNYDIDSSFVSLWQIPSLLLQKLPAPRFTATTKVRIAAKAENQYAGLVMMGRDYASIVACRRGDHFIIERRDCKGADNGNQEKCTAIESIQPTESDVGQYHPSVYLDIFFRAVVSDGSCQLQYSVDGKKFKDAGNPFILKEGKWIGSKIGFLSLAHSRSKNRGWLDIDWIRFTN